jgi:hypothetical protein
MRLVVGVVIKENNGPESSSEHIMVLVEQESGPKDAWR